MNHSPLLPVLWLTFALLPSPRFLAGGEEPQAGGASLQALQARVEALEKQIAELKKASYKPTLGEFMTSVQSRHAKLWFALAAGNQKLAAFELHELGETLEDLAKWHPTHRDAPQPLKEMIETGLGPALAQLRQMAQTGDQPRFAAAFDELTNACNACHQATAHGYNVIKRPVAPPFSNQIFAPLPGPQ